MPDKDIPLKLVWREPLGAFCGGALFVMTFPLRDGTPLGVLMIYPPYFVGVLVILALYVAPFALFVGLAAGQTIWWLHLRWQKRVEAAVRVAVGVVYASAAAGAVALVCGINGWLAVRCGVLVGTCAGMLSTGQDVPGPESRK